MNSKPTAPQLALLNLLPRGPFGLRGAQHSTARALAGKGLARWMPDGDRWDSSGRYVITDAGREALAAAQRDGKVQP